MIKKLAMWVILTFCGLAMLLVAMSLGRSKPDSSDPSQLKYPAPLINYHSPILSNSNPALVSGDIKGTRDPNRLSVVTYVNKPGYGWIVCNPSSARINQDGTWQCELPKDVRPEDVQEIKSFLIDTADIADVVTIRNKDEEPWTNRSYCSLYLCLR